MLCRNIKQLLVIKKKVGARQDEQLSKKDKWMSSEHTRLACIGGNAETSLLTFDVRGVQQFTTGDEGVAASWLRGTPTMGG